MVAHGIRAYLGGKLKAIGLIAVRGVKIGTIRNLAPIFEARPLACILPFSFSFSPPFATKISLHKARAINSIRWALEQRNSKANV